VFAHVERLRRRAAQLVQGHPEAPAAPPLPHEAEAETIAAGVELRLPRLVERFSLSDLSVDALLCLFAAEYDPFMRLVMRALQREQGPPYLEVGTIAELLDLPPARLPELARELAARAPLRRWALCTIDDASREVPVVSARARISPRVAQYLVGEDLLPEGVTRLLPGRTLEPPLMPAPVAERVLERVRAAVSADEALLVEIAGPAGCGKRQFAETLASALGRILICADLSLAPRDKLEAALAQAQREARLCDGLLCLARWDSHLDEPPRDGEAPPPRPRVLPAAMAQLLIDLDGVVMLTAKQREPILEMGERPIVHADVRFPSPSERAVLLDKALARHGGGAESEVDFTQLARRFALDPARLSASARAAVELARERHATTVSYAELTDACRRQLRHDLESVAVRVTASHRWEDLVIPVDVYYALQEMIAYVRHAEQVYGEWGFGQRHGLGRGISTLFAGPPGTGKTMCAAVMARELDMELFQVDLSRVVSKWIGETEKNLAKVFDEGERSNAIILFDEADSLFARRTEVKSSVDRYANLEVNYLLQRMESFGGITILTTNFEDTLDSAFKRRLTFRVRFEKPDADARAALWSKVFPSSCRLAEDVSPELLGARFEMSGANIRNAALRAAFLAAAEGRAVDLEMVMQAAERECREMGLLVRSEVAPPSPPPPQKPSEYEDDSPPTVPARPKLVPVTHPRR
jgi:SpoVK/Ycf46/Vps4 family AAA+-type ATPase